MFTNNMSSNHRFSWYMNIDTISELHSNVYFNIQIIYIYIYDIISASYFSDGVNSFNSIIGKFSGK